MAVFSSSRTAVAGVSTVLVFLLLCVCCITFAQAASRKMGIKRYDALVNAARKNDISAIQRALKKGANVNMVRCTLLCVS